MNKERRLEITTFYNDDSYRPKSINLIQVEFDKSQKVFITLIFTEKQITYEYDITDDDDKSSFLRTLASIDVEFDCCTMTKISDTLGISVIENKKVVLGIEE